jgi:hypothetical protein
MTQAKPNRRPVVTVRSVGQPEALGAFARLLVKMQPSTPRLSLVDVKPRSPVPPVVKGPI